MEARKVSNEDRKAAAKALRAIQAKARKEAEAAEYAAWAARVDAKWARYFARGTTIEAISVQVEV